MFLVGQYEYKDHNDNDDEFSTDIEFHSRITLPNNSHHPAKQISNQQAIHMPYNKDSNQSTAKSSNESTDKTSNKSTGSSFDIRIVYLLFLSLCLTNYELTIVIYCVAPKEHVLIFLITNGSGLSPFNHI